MWFLIKEKITKLIRLFFAYLNAGENCIVCGKQAYIYPLCKNCIKKYYSLGENIKENKCSICGRTLISTVGLCSKCRENPVLRNTDCVTPLFSYRLWNKELLFLWKINQVRNISFLFGSLVNKALRILNYSVIVPVPPRKGKIRKKGWDQIEELTEILVWKYGYIKLNILKRISIEEQKKLNRIERLETIKNAYVLAEEEKVKKELKKTNGKLPESVCLIDDVATTGATLECCSEILKKAGVKVVNVVTLFIVD